MAATVSPAEKVKQFPSSPGVYLMKDAQGVVLYIGKAKNLRNRAGHYFTKAGAEDKRTADKVAKERALREAEVAKRNAEVARLTTRDAILARGRECGGGW